MPQEEKKNRRVQKIASRVANTPAPSPPSSVFSRKNSREKMSLSPCRGKNSNRNLYRSTNKQKQKRNSKTEHSKTKFKNETLKTDKIESISLSVHNVKTKPQSRTPQTGSQKAHEQLKNIELKIENKRKFYKTRGKP